MHRRTSISYDQQVALVIEEQALLSWEVQNLGIIQFKPMLQDCSDWLNSIHCTICHGAVDTAVANFFGEAVCRLCQSYVVSDDEPTEYDLYSTYEVHAFAPAMPPLFQ